MTAPTADQIAEGIYRAQRRRDEERGKGIAWALALALFGPAIVLSIVSIGYLAADAVGLAKPCMEHDFVPAREYVWAWDDCADRPAAVMARRVGAQADAVRQIIAETQPTTETTR